MSSILRVASWVDSSSSWNGGGCLAEQSQSQPVWQQFIHSFICEKQMLISVRGFPNEKLKTWKHFLTCFTLRYSQVDSSGSVNHFLVHWLIVGSGRRIGKETRDYKRFSINLTRINNGNNGNCSPLIETFVRLWQYCCSHSELTAEHVFWRKKSTDNWTRDPSSTHRIALFVHLLRLLSHLTFCPSN